MVPHFFYELGRYVLGERTYGFHLEEESVNLRRLICLRNKKIEQNKY